MKIIIVILVSLLGVTLATSEPEPEPECPSEAARTDLSHAAMHTLLHELKFKTTLLENSMKSMKTIGRGAITILEKIVTDSGGNNKCLNLEVFNRPVHITIPEERSLVASGEEMNAAEMSRQLHAVGHHAKVLGAKLMKFKEIGRENIGRLNRFVEAVRRGICGAEHHSPCPPDYLAYGDFCYKEVIARMKTWQEAQDLCHGEGAHLPGISNADEDTFLLTMLQSSAPGHSVHIGLNRIAEGATKWTWVHSDAEPSFTNWNTCKPQQDSHKCVYLCMGSRKWVTSDCSTKRRVVCQKPKTSAPATVAA